jgi:hypothetical protein
MSTLRDRVIQEHIHRNYPNAQIQNYDDPGAGLTFYSAEELQSLSDEWFPLCCYKDDATGKAIYGGRQKVYHTYTEGETGSGKTTRFVMQSILALSSLKNKPSFVIVDIHGEIIENLYNHLKQNGYNIRILNCDNPRRSDTYNPFAELAGECLRTRTISNESINKIRKIAEIIQPIESTREPIWDQGARSYTNGCILDKFEDLINGEIPEECLTIYNVIQNHYWLRDVLAHRNPTNDLFRILHYKKKGSKALSTQKMISVTNNADKTRASYFGVVENHYDTFGQPSMYSLSSNNTIDIAAFLREPTVIVIQSGSTKIGDDLISLLMNDIYTCVVKAGKESPTKKLPRNIHCFLDEFANCNIADGKLKMLTTSRKFGMYWHMILQCDAQLDRKFDPNISRSIRANSTELFMGSHDYETEIRFAKSCGQKTIESLASVIAQQDPRLEVVDLMTTDQLNLTPEGYIYVKSNRCSLLRTYIEAFYNCQEFEPVEDIDTVYPYNDFDYYQTAFSPDDLPSRINGAEYEILTYLQDESRSLQELIGQYPDYQVKKVIRSLAQKSVVELLPDQMVRAKVTGRTFDLYRYRAQHHLLTEIPAEQLTAAAKTAADEAAPSPDDQTAAKPMSESEMEQWLADDAAKVKNPMFEDLRKHLSRSNIIDIMQKLRRLTIIPESLMDAVAWIGKTAQEQAKIKVILSDNPNILKFEIIEIFIKQNDFVTKEEWTNQMKEELDYLKKEHIFPFSVMWEFERATREVDVDLTLGNIREIKKIISG